MTLKIYFKYGFLLLLNFILSFMSYIIPKKENSYLLGSKDCSKFFGNPKYFFLYLCKYQNDCNFYWITSNKKILKDLKTRNLPVLYLYSLNGFIGILRSKFLIFTHGISDLSYSIMLPGKFNKIQTWHGTPLKKIEKGSIKNLDFTQKLLQRFIVNSKENRSYHTILAASEETKRIFNKVFENKNVSILGFPRNDVFFNNAILYDNYEKTLNLNKYEKVILYCPTFRDNPSSKIVFSADFLEKLNNYMKDLNYIFLIKKHINEKQIFNVNNFSNIIDVSDKVEDVQDLLVFTDILITDYSSVFFDFVLCDRPIIFYCYDFKEYLKNSRDMYYDYFEEMPGPFAKNQDELFQLLTSIEKLFIQNEYKEKYELFRKKFNYYLDGQSSERLYEHLK